MRKLRFLIPVLGKLLIMFRLICLILVLCVAESVYAGKITLKSVDRPAEEVFAEVMRQSGKNFIYSSDILKGLKVRVDVKNKSLGKTLRELFKGTDIEYKIKGDNILLMRRKKEKFVPKRSISDPRLRDTDSIKVGILRDVIVDGSRNKTLAMNSTDIGALNVSKDMIARTPVIFGESDVIKTLQFEPGVSGGVEGTAGLYVHGGNMDENLYMLDNIPLYQVNHLGGLFSAFNTEAIKNVDFYKSTFPAKFDGRLSSFMDVYTRDGSNKKLNGSIRLGLTSGAAHFEGPLYKDKTTFSLSARRSWYELLTLPAVAIANSINDKEDDDFSFGYAFTDVNAKITHKFSNRSRVYALFYYGEDYLNNGTHTPEDKKNDYYDKDESRLRWGNIVASAGWIYDFTPSLWGKVCGAFTRYYSTMSTLTESATLNDGEKLNFTSNKVSSHNSISDWIIKADFEWRSSMINKLNFGASMTFHNFLPSRDSRELVADGVTTVLEGNGMDYKAREFNIYAEDNLSLGDRLKLNFGLHYSLFNITGKTKFGLSPRIAFNYHLKDNVAIKGGYSRTVQYIHQLSQSSISLPTDQWVPVIDSQSPQVADKIAVGAYWNAGNMFVVSVEGYYKWMKHLVDYKDEYYLLPPDMQWNAVLAEGKGTSKGVDFKISKEFGKVSGQISYSLLWADRQFAERNGGRKYPARFDNRHKINVLVNWKINDKWELGASWTGMSGNMITLPTQCWVDPGLAPWHYNMLLKTDINNFRLPFYHRLDLIFTRHTRHGYWTFGLYNAYCNMNTIAVRMDYSNSQFISAPDENGYYSYKMIPVFQKIKLLPTIPSVSYTWLF